MPENTTTGCDCATCATGDDRWCCRRCHDLASPTDPTKEGGA